eukprot:5448628-Prymnesium_polylepis.1
MSGRDRDAGASVRVDAIDQLLAAPRSASSASRKISPSIPLRLFVVDHAADQPSPSRPLLHPPHVASCLIINFDNA